MNHRAPKVDKLLLFLIDSNLWIVSSTFDLETLYSNKGLLILIKLSIIVFMVVELSPKQSH